MPWEGKEHRNAAAQLCHATEVSVLVPFYRDDPLPLVRQLAEQVADCLSALELVVLDDGGGVPALTAAVRSGIDALDIPARLLVADHNCGRSRARNTLALHAKGDWLLFLDADMRIPPGFIATWLAAREADFDAAFGGYVPDNPLETRFCLHARLAAASDVKSAKERNEVGPVAFSTCNLLVRSEVMRRVSFDESYTGWGWEDVDWAVAAARAFRLVHVDNPAGHGGLHSPEVLLNRFKSAAKNHARLIRKHPELAAMPGARLAALLRRLPGQQRLRGVWAHGTTAARMPMPARVLALKLWRASWAAEEIGR